jgi:hypothetical protein
MSGQFGLDQVVSDFVSEHGTNGKVDISAYAVKLGNIVRDAVSDEDRMRFLIGIICEGDFKVLQPLFGAIKHTQTQARQVDVQYSVLNHCMESSDVLRGKIRAARKEMYVLELELDTLVGGLASISELVSTKKKLLSELQEEKIILEDQLEVTKKIIRASSHDIESMLDSLDTILFNTAS